MWSSFLSKGRPPATRYWLACLAGTDYGMLPRGLGTHGLRFQAAARRTLGQVPHEQVDAHPFRNTTTSSTTSQRLGLPADSGDADPKERLLDQAQARTPYTLWGIIRVAYPNA